MRSTLRETVKKNSVDLSQFIFPHESDSTLFAEDTEQIKKDFAMLKAKLTDMAFSNKIFEFKKNYQVSFFSSYFHRKLQ